MCPKSPRPSNQATYLVAITDYVILGDIADTISEFDPSARVIALASPDQATLALAPVESLTVAFIETSPLQFAGSDLANAIASRGGRVVFFGSAAEDEAKSTGRRVLQRPFSSDTLLRQLALLTSK